MKKIASYILLINLSFISCQGDKSGKLEENTVENAFSKIDEKNKSLFTKEERVNSYKKSIAIVEDSNKSLRKNATYSGYGSSNFSDKSLKNKSQKKESKKKKKTTYSYKTNSSPQTFSAYSTN